MIHFGADGFGKAVKIGAVGINRRRLLDQGRRRRCGEFEMGANRGHDGVMLGRAPYQNPWLLSEVDTRLFGASGSVSEDREAAIDAMLPYIEQQLSDGARLHHMTRHMLGLFQGQYGGRQYRRHLSEHAHKAESDIEVLCDAMAFTAIPPKLTAAG